MPVMHPPTITKEQEVGVLPVVRPFPSFGYAEIPDTKEIVGTGWIPELPDMRDYTAEHPEVVKMVEKIAKLGVSKKGAKALGTPPAQVDLRPWCSPIENQLALGSCTAHAAVGIVEYFEKRVFGKYTDGSRLFVYKNTRKLLGWTGDTGAFLRTTMAALTMFGVPPEPYWPYTDESEPGLSDQRTFDAEPSVFVYEMADKFDGTSYFCHDPWRNPPPPANVLNSVKTYLAAGIPAMFGFFGFPSCNQADVKGAFPYPAPGERAIWGHAVDAVGYDDNLKITNLVSRKTTTGALLIRNSWGTAWGNAGYGYLPYDYVTNQLAQDFWSLLNMRWIDLDQFAIKTLNT